MNLVLSILLGLLGIVVLLLLIAAFVRKEYEVVCETTISKPKLIVFNYLKHFISVY